MKPRRKRGRASDDAEHFKQAVRHWAGVLKVSPTQVRVQRMTRKWASCSSAGRLSFSTALLREPEPFQRYVILHELLHLRVPNHGRMFKAYLSAYLPGWQRYVRKLTRLREALTPLSHG